MTALKQVDVWLTPETLKELVTRDRLAKVLVRCDGGRFTCPAQDAQHFIDIMEKGGEWVRDVSLQS